MAQKVNVVLVDDLDGGKASETVMFGLDGVAYEIDLSDKNAAKLRDAFASWVGHARKVGSRNGVRRPGRGGRGRPVDVTAVRDWGRQNGFTVSERGRLSVELQQAYREAH
jgi:hypothetical protein